ncbi:MAG: hypothetical protein JWM80_2429, partial [Cyanobacteria bacterium RYN_339]|nr:hypothetical protein [Cyanobacteria bacterium RYN_339]
MRAFRTSLLLALALAAGCKTPAATGGAAPQREGTVAARPGLKPTTTGPG